MKEMRGKDMAQKGKFILILGLIMILLSGCTVERIELTESVNVNVTNDESLDVNISNNVIDVFIQDQTTIIIDLKMTETINNITLQQSYNIDNVYLNITSLIAPQSDDVLCLREDNRFYQGHIKNVISLGGNLYQVKMDRPLDYSFSNNGIHSLENGDWAVDGSITPRIFSVSPRDLNTDWDITRIILTCIGDGVTGADPTPDLSSFFVMDALDNGIVLRTKDGIYQNIFGVDNNFHMVGETYDLTFYPKNKFGFYGVATRRTFAGPEKNGVVIRLESSQNDELQLIIQDDLTPMEECHIIAQGHEVED